jgi:dihydroxy-acid dehydratase
MEDIHKIGGIPAILKYLLNHTNLIDGSQMTVTGKTLAENLADVTELEFDKQDVFRALDNPIKPTGHLTILRGNLAPESAVAKLTGKEGLRFDGTARCFDESVSFFHAISKSNLRFVFVCSVWILFINCWKGARSPPEWSLFLGTKVLREHQACQKC